MPTSQTSQSSRPSPLTHWHPGINCCDTEWEEYYVRFETPEQEIQKFQRRHKIAGVDQWPKDWEIVEIFCGRGNGLKALERFGFSNLEGVDLSPDLLKKYDGPAKLYVDDCREMKFADNSKDAICVQGGLHHVPKLPEDLEMVLSEVQRILKPGGKFFVVEPWLTLFLRFMHGLCSISPLRRVWPKLDAMAGMIDHELDTYLPWLASKQQILDLLQDKFVVEKQYTAFAKLMFVGHKRLD